MRVLQVVEASFAGVGRHVIDLSRHLVAAGVELDLAYGRDRADQTFLDAMGDVGFCSTIAFETGPGIGLDDLSVVRQIRGILRGHGPGTGGHDIVHGHASKGGALARLAGLGGRAATVYTPNALITQAPHIGSAKRVVYRGLEVAMARGTDHLIYVSEEEAAHGRSIGLRPRGSSVVPNGIDPIDLPSRAEARAALDLEAVPGLKAVPGLGGGPGLGGVPGRVSIGFVGRLSPQKNVGLLVEAYRLLVERLSAAAEGGSEPLSTELVIIGEGDDEAELRAAAAGLPVRFLGRQPGPTSMPAFDVFALPSQYEGFPYVLLEALQAGVPCVATEGCAAGPLLEGRGARVAGAGSIVELDPVAMADALEVLVRGADVRRAASEAALEVSRRFSAEAMAASVMAVYRDLSKSAEQTDRPVA